MSMLSKDLMLECIAITQARPEMKVCTLALSNRASKRMSKEIVVEKMFSGSFTKERVATDGTY